MCVCVCGCLRASGSAGYYKLCIVCVCVLLCDCVLGNFKQATSSCCCNITLQVRPQINKTNSTNDVRRTSKICLCLGPLFRYSPSSSPLHLTQNKDAVDSLPLPLPLPLDGSWKTFHIAAEAAAAASATATCNSQLSSCQGQSQ